MRWHGEAAKLLYTVFVFVLVTCLGSMFGEREEERRSIRRKKLLKLLQKARLAEEGQRESEKRG